MKQVEKEMAFDGKMVKSGEAVDVVKRALDAGAGE